MSNKAPVWFMVVAVLAVIWNAAGVSAFVMDIMMTAEDLAKLSQTEQDLYAARPQWVTTAFGVAVVAGFAGSVMMVIKRSYACYLLAISLVAVIAQQSYMFLVSDMFEKMGQEAMIMPLAVLVIAFALFILAKVATKKHWLK